MQRWRKLTLVSLICFRIFSFFCLCGFLKNFAEILIFVEFDDISVETYPTEAMRAELSQKLGLSDRQLQMWFCHRRLKNKKDLPPKKPRKTAIPLPDSPTDELRMGPEVGNGYGSGSGSGSSPFARSEQRNVGPRGIPGYYESPQSILELRAVACVEAQLGEPLREDGPVLGIEFDPLPPDAFGAPIGIIYAPTLNFPKTYYF